MPAWEIKLLVYIVLGLGYTAFVSWESVTLESHHRDRVEAADKLAQASQVEAQQAQSISDLKVQQAATVAAEQKYVDLKAATSGISDQLARSVSEYSSLRRGVLSTNASTAALADAARQSAERDSGLTSLVRQATSFCLDDSATLTAFQIWATSLSKK